ncbi:tRNA (guanosine(46)-N7)-methyltransferase TrmB [Helicobacter sp. NHP22-001]|uniref:tRNA (guanosine(46)-N7)-methyltransferase TrmB n=1 Tax=Helicobacter sp. NHP22-001 TaxID=3040202 RepID=UPI00244D9095|nr:tRNA (guanosine(46)-N7)-methyltransferase TrmB [Helicobacter sp. NHP22-001]GMB96648.1 tRNA (guanine-N(7)-)-methyltransferase TrmB [Helicobacter sp. NHP22-001]
MPHFYAKELATPPMPFEEQGFKFCYEAQSLRDPRVSLIRVQHPSSDFCLLKIVQQGGVLCKGEKSSRPIPVGILQHALEILSHYGKQVRGNLALSHCPSQAFLLDFKHFNFESFYLEIGFGSGRFLLQKAQANPENIYIGLEVHTPSIEQVLRQIELLELKNLYIAHADARTLLEVLPPNCEGLDIHFPVPWPKHPNRRIFTPHTLENMLAILRPKGEIWLRTDSLEYFKSSLELALNAPTCQATIAKNAPQEVVSKYEARWVRQEKDIYDLRLQSSAKSVHPNLPLLLPMPQNVKPKGVKASSLWQKKPIIGEDYFLNIQDVLEYEDSWLLAVSLGDVRFPLNKILCWDRGGGGLEYVGGVPFNTKAQRHAHEALCALLQEV